MKPKTRKPLNFTAEHAAHAIGMLVSEGRIAERDVVNALHRREKLIDDLRERLAALEQGVISGTQKARRKVTRQVRPKGKRKMSATRRAALKLHGKYLGHIRTLPKAAKTKIKKIRARTGVQAAIRAARAMANRAAPGAKPQRGGQGTEPDYQSPTQRRLAKYQQRERPKPDKHGGSGAGRQQGGSGAGRERG